MMLKKSALILLLLSAILFSLQISSEGVLIGDLIDNAKSYDEKTVTVQGEAIGDIMKRGDFGWVNIMDKTGTIGIWAESSALEKIKYKGDYKHIGDTIMVKGIFNRSCNEHGGDTDIHAEELTVLSVGKVVRREIDQRKLIWLAVLIAVFCVIVLLKYYIAREKQKKSSI